MIQVGRHENLVITKTVKNDQGSLVIGVKQMTQVNPLEALNSSGQTAFDAPQQDFIIYPPKSTTFQGERDTLKNLLLKVGDIKDPLDHIASIYMPAGARKWDLFANTGITPTTNLEEELNKQSVMDIIYNNIVNQFITMMAPFVGEGGKRVRMIFPRTSVAKHYPTLRKRYLSSQPFIESMEVPAAASKLAFSKYEKEKGLDKGDVVSTAAAQNVSNADAQEADALFTTSR